MKTRFLTTIACGLALMTAPGIASAADTNVMFILDGSNSMWGQVDGVAKIETAKKTLTSMLTLLDPDIKVGLMSYGHNRDEDCTDVEVLAPIGSEPAMISERIAGIVPKGKTPITFALETSMHQFPGKDASNHLVLISDGKETCGGDPCQLAGTLAKKGISLKIHVVGFDVTDEESQQLMCIADAGGGRYFNADSADGLREAISAITEEVEIAQAAPQPRPAAKPAGPQLYFEDNFDGAELGENWEVLNPNPDGYIVESGELLAITGSPAANLGSEEAENIFRLTKPLPEGDWTATIEFRMGYMTGVEAAYLVLFDDNSNYVGGVVGSWSYYEAIRGARVYLYGFKLAKGQQTHFEKVIWGGPGGVAYGENDPPNPYLLRLTKVGRSYTPAVKMEGMTADGATPEWIEHEKFTVLRPKGNLAIGVYQAKQVPGETALMIDWIKIETP